MPRLVLIALFLCSIGVSAQESRTVDLTYDEAWSKVAQALVMKGLSISTQDKDAGFIKVEGSFRGRMGFTCPGGPGARDSQTYEVNVALSGDDDKTTVTVNTQATERRYRNNKFIFFTVGREWDEYECKSNGTIEKAIFDSLSTPSQ